MLPARREDVAHVAAHMRESDRDEVDAWSGRDPESALLSALGCSTLCWTGSIDGAAAAMFGVSAPVALVV